MGLRVAAFITAPIPELCSGHLQGPGPEVPFNPPRQGDGKKKQRTSESGGPEKSTGARDVGEKGFGDHLLARNPKFLRSFLYPLSFTLLTLSQALTQGLRERVQDSLASRWVIVIFSMGTPLSYMTPPN